jgi:hypothetical protein
MPSVLVGLCFNCLRPGHVAIDYPNAPRCLCYRREGHKAWSCKRPRSPDATDPPRQQRATVAVLNPREGDITLAEPRAHPSRPPAHLARWDVASRSQPTSPIGSAPSSDRQPSPGYTPRGPGPAPTPNGSSLLHVLPSPPPSLLLGAPIRQPRFELCIIPGTGTMDEVEAGLANVSVVVVVAPTVRVTRGRPLLFGKLPRRLRRGSGRSPLPETMLPAQLQPAVDHR